MGTILKRAICIPDDVDRPDVWEIYLPKIPTLKRKEKQAAIIPPIYRLLILCQMTMLDLQGE